MDEEKTIQPLEEAYLTGVFEELAKLEIELDSDPLAFGPKRLNQKVALARKMTTDCERMFLDAAQLHSSYKRAQRRADLTLDMSMKYLLANDPEVRAGRAVSEREAIASGKLKTEVHAVAAAKQAIEDLETVISVIKAKRADLRDIQGRLRDQMRLCQEEIGLGNRWGSKSPRGIELQPGQGFVTSDQTTAIEDIIDDVRKASGEEKHLPAEIDDSDPQDEIEASLRISASEPESEPESKPEPEPESKPEPEPKPEPDNLDILEASPEVVTAEAVLPDEVDSEDVASFLASTTADVPPVPKSRYQVEEEDSLDLASILEHFS